MTSKNEILSPFHTLGRFVDEGWKNKQDFQILNQTVKTVEQMLKIRQGYNIFLYPNPPLNKDGLPIKYGAFVTFSDNIASPCVLIVENFDDPGHYAIKDKDDNIIYSINVDRNDLIIANLSEEIFHLNDYRLGRIPKGLSTGGGSEKYIITKSIPFEIDASLFRVKVLSALNPLKWTPFARFVDILSKSHQKFSVIWES